MTANEASSPPVSVATANSTSPTSTTQTTSTGVGRVAPPHVAGDGRDGGERDARALRRPAGHRRTAPSQPRKTTSSISAPTSAARTPTTAHPSGLADDVAPRRGRRARARCRRPTVPSTLQARGHDEGGQRPEQHPPADPLGDRRHPAGADGERPGDGRDGEERRRAGAGRPRTAPGPGRVGAVVLHAHHRPEAGEQDDLEQGQEDLHDEHEQREQEHRQRALPGAQARACAAAAGTTPSSGAGRTWWSVIPISLATTAAGRAISSRPRISMDSNSGGDTRRPVTATRSGPKANLGLMPRPSTIAARRAASIALRRPRGDAFQRGERGVEHLRRVVLQRGDGLVLDDEGVVRRRAGSRASAAASARRHHPGLHQRGRLLDRVALAVGRLARRARRRAAGGRRSGR